MRLAVASQNPIELHEILMQLRAAVREHVKRVGPSAVLSAHGRRLLGGWNSD
jgi:hypothetical protein